MVLTHILVQEGGLTIEEIRGPTKRKLGQVDELSFLNVDPFRR